MVRKRERDIYGNWVWVDEELGEKEREESERSNLAKKEPPRKNEGKLHLDWRDYLALTIASLETFLLPIVIFIVVLIVIVLILPFLRH